MLRFSLWVAARPLWLRRSRNLGQRFKRGHALRPDEFAAEGQARPDIRARIRSIVIRTRARHAAIRIRVAVAAIDHTACAGRQPVHIAVVRRGRTVGGAYGDYCHIEAVGHSCCPCAGVGMALDHYRGAVGEPYTPLADIAVCVRKIHPVHHVVLVAVYVLIAQTADIVHLLDGL